MKPRNALIVLAVGLVVLIGGWFLGPARLPGTSRHFSAGKLMFPDLAGKLANAARIELTGGGKTLVLARRPAPATGWGVAARALYPVQADKLHALLTALAELRLLSPRTADPAQYGRLGVGDPHQAGSSAVLLRVLDAKGTPLAALIVGHRQVIGAGHLPDQVFVRRPGSAQSWLAEGGLDVDADPQIWLDRSVMNIGHGEIAAIAVMRGGTTLHFERKAGRLVLSSDGGAAAPAKLSPYKLDDLDRGLEVLTFDDVTSDAHPTAGMTPGAAIGTAVFTTDNGLEIGVHLFAAPAGSDPTDPSILARFTATGTGKAVATAQRLTARLAGWTYRLGSWKTRMLVPTLADLAAKPAPPKATNTAARPAAAATPAQP